VKIKHEEVFVELSEARIAVAPSERGRLQFFNWTTHGEVPQQPDDYFCVLREGKNALDSQVRFLRHCYDPQRYPAASSIEKIADALTEQGVPLCGWEGWAVYYLRWSEQARRLLFAWHKDVPEWFWDSKGEMFYRYLEVEALRPQTIKEIAEIKASR